MISLKNSIKIFESNFDFKLIFNVNEKNIELIYPSQYERILNRIRDSLYKLRIFYKLTNCRYIVFDWISLTCDKECTFYSIASDTDASICCMSHNYYICNLMFYPSDVQIDVLKQQIINFYNDAANMLCRKPFHIKLRNS